MPVYTDDTVGTINLPTNKTFLGKLKKADLVAMTLTLLNKPKEDDDSDDGCAEEQEIWEKGWHQGKEDCMNDQDEEIAALKARVGELSELVKGKQVGEGQLRQTIQDCSVEIQKLEKQIETLTDKISKREGCIEHLLETNAAQENINLTIANKKLTTRISELELRTPKTAFCVSEYKLLFKMLDIDYSKDIKGSKAFRAHFLEYIQNGKDQITELQDTIEHDLYTEEQLDEEKRVLTEENTKLTNDMKMIADTIATMAASITK